MPGGNAPEQEHAFEKQKPAVHSLAIHTKMRSKVGHVDQPPRGRCGVVDQANQFIAFSDRSDVGDIAFGKGAHIGV